MNAKLTRRNFLRQTSAAGATIAALAPLGLARAQSSPNSKVRIGIMGCNARGMTHINGYLNVPNVEIAYICDVDKRAVAKGIAAVSKKQEHAPQGVDDFRRMLDDKNVDAISVATPDFWHAPATIYGCAAGKHVYVEKPGSHNAHESELMVAAAAKNKRLVQMGNQRRSWSWVQESIKALHDGEIGKIRFARTWYTSKRGSIGRGKPAPVPNWLNYELWQGPTTEREYRDNVIHYNWHWFWHWGTGELGNNGVHGLDLVRWGLQVDYPQRVTCGGNRYHYQDDQESPDIIIPTFDFGHCGAMWEGQSCDPRGFEGAGFGVFFYGDKGTLVIANNNTIIYDLSNTVVREIKGKSNETVHFANFIDAIRDGKPLNSPIADGQKSTMLCHYGNIAWRSGQTVDVDPKTGKLAGNSANQKFWQREYRKGWEPKV